MNYNNQQYARWITLYVLLSYFCKAIYFATVLCNKLLSNLTCNTVISIASLDIPGFSNLEWKVCKCKSEFTEGGRKLNFHINYK